MNSRGYKVLPANPEQSEGIAAFFKFNEMTLVIPFHRRKRTDTQRSKLPRSHNTYMGRGGAAGFKLQPLHVPNPTICLLPLPAFQDRGG